MILRGNSVDDASRVPAGTGGGGGLYADRASVHINRSRFTDNHVGGTDPSFLAGAGVMDRDSDVTITASTFDANTAPGSGANGGAVAVTHSSMTALVRLYKSLGGGWE